MKYIRTKDGKIFVADIYEPISTDKVADTIEELVDLYVCVESNGNHTILPSNQIISIIGTIIYGAIWTDKGLIYVAKMNEKGELELL